MSRQPQAPANPQPQRLPIHGTAVRVCPECAGPLARSSGCISCLHCGWGRCG